MKNDVINTFISIMFSQITSGKHAFTKPPSANQQSKRKVHWHLVKITWTVYRMLVDIHIDLTNNKILSYKQLL